MVFIFDEAEIKYMWGALEVFIAANEKVGFEAFEAAVVAETDRPVVCTNGWKVIPTYTIANCPQPDLLVVAGGRGVHECMHRETLINWLKKIFRKVEFLLAIGMGIRE
jgi:transcriptional regulator GlxA family with amidase domain